MPRGKVTVVVELKNAKVRALRCVAEALEELDDMDWRPEIKRAKKALLYTMKRLVPRQVH
jgi:hypothetical protein